MRHGRAWTMRQQRMRMPLSQCRAREQRTKRVDTNWAAVGFAHEVEVTRRGREAPAARDGGGVGSSLGSVAQRSVPEKAQALAGDECYASPAARDWVAWLRGGPE